MKVHILEREQTVGHPLAFVFEFFADPRNLDPITPGFLRFEFLADPPAEMRAGSTLYYRIRLHGVPVRWRAMIELWEPPARFVDVQESGPYTLWRHMHTFEALAPAKTIVRDRVEFALPMGPLGEIAYRLFVARDLKRIFDYRAARLPEILDQAAAANLARPPIVAAD